MAATTTITLEPAPKARAISVLGYALLGLLAREPLSGYELAQRMKMPVAFFWHARHSQIYPELARLEADGLIAHHVVEQHDRPHKKVHVISALGRTALRTWVTAPAAPAPVREELMLKAYSVWVADSAKAQTLFREQEHYHRERLARYEMFREQMERECGPDLHHVDSPSFGTYATLRAGLGYERQAVEWCAWMAAQLEEATVPAAHTTRSG